MAYCILYYRADTGALCGEDLTVADAAVRKMTPEPGVVAVARHCSDDSLTIHCADGRTWHPGLWTGPLRGPTEAPKKRKFRSISEAAEAALNTTEIHEQDHYRVHYAGRGKGWVAICHTWAAHPVLYAATAEQAATGDFWTSPFVTGGLSARWSEAVREVADWYKTQ